MNGMYWVPRTHTIELEGTSFKLMSIWKEGTYHLGSEIIQRCKMMGLYTSADCLYRITVDGKRMKEEHCKE